MSSCLLYTSLMNTSLLDVASLLSASLLSTSLLDVASLLSSSLLDVASKLVLVLINLSHCPGHQSPLPLNPAHPPISDLLVALSACV